MHNNYDFDLLFVLFCIDIRHKRKDIMAEMEKDNMDKTGAKMPMAAEGDKPTDKMDEGTGTAPMMDKSVEGNESIDAQDIDDTLTILNVMDKENGGKGMIAELPEALRGSIKYLIEKLIFVRDAFEDPTWKLILDDMADQKEDGQMPSVEVAIARTVPMDKLMEMAENEDYEGAQGELSAKMDSDKQMAEEDEMAQANFAESQEAGKAYAVEMGYDETKTNALFQKVMDLFAVMADGKLTKVEFAEIDKMLNYDMDTENLRNQIGTQEAKEVLPDKASVDAAMSSSMPKKAAPAKNMPGMGSMGAYESPMTDVTQVGKRNRSGRK